jgi:hypothetical protein
MDSGGVGEDELFGLIIRYVLEESGINTETPEKGQEHFRTKSASESGFLRKNPSMGRHSHANNSS